MSALAPGRSSKTVVLHGPVAPFDRPAIALLLVSGSLLFVELLLIRWIPSEIVYVGYFRNLILLGSFLGIGLGIVLGRDGRVPALPLFALTLLAATAVVRASQLNVGLSSTDEIFFGLTDTSRAADTNYAVLPLVVALATVSMALLALPLGPLLRSMSPLRAYAIDIAGSLGGIALFTVLSWLETPPFVWFAVAGILLGLRALGRPITGWSTVGAVAMVAMVLIASRGSAGDERWSPYQRITIGRSPLGVGITVNGIPHQGFSAQGVASTQGTDADFYFQVDRWFPERTFERVLIVGAGTGNDVAARLRGGASAIDAVEIDPALLRIGVEEHPDRPYQDLRVRSIVDDGRSFLREAAGPYDLVVFALPNSLTLVGSTANIRLESFLFTAESFREVRGLLGPDGVFVLYNYYREPWLVDKLAGMLRDSFGTPPVIRSINGVTGTAAILADGPGVGGISPQATGTAAHLVLDPAAPPRPATDDWPFLYLKEPTIGSYYLLVLGIVLAMALFCALGALRVTKTPVTKFSPHFFALGVAFLLLETRSLTTFGLLFGNTWLVNAFVFFAILVSVLLAIGVNARLRIRDPRPLYAALGAALLLNFAVDPAALLVDPPGLRYLLASALAFAPVFFANLVFTRSFRDTRTADMAFASNLLGAMVGGVLEYLALLTGYRALALVVMACYGAAYLLATRLRLLADRDLVATDETIVGEELLAPA